MNKSKSFSYAKYGYLFSIPFVVAYLIFSFYPTINTIILGFTDAKGMAGLTNWNFLPAEDLFKNFIAVLKAPTFRKSLGNTIILWVANFIPQISLALLLTAWFTSKRNELRGQGFFKVVFYMPNIITAASIAILFKALFAYPVGPVNSLLVKLGLATEAVNFTTKVWPTRGIIAFIQFWMWYGNTMIVLISGVLGINPDLYEAAELDAASIPKTGSVVFTVVAVAIAFLALVVFVMAFPQLAVYSNSVKNYLKNGFVLFMCAPHVLLLSAAAWAAPWVLAYIEPEVLLRFGVMYLLWGFAFPAYATVRLLSKVFQKTKQDG